MRKITAALFLFSATVGVQAAQAREVNSPNVAAGVLDLESVTYWADRDDVQRLEQELEATYGFTPRFFGRVEFRGNKPYGGSFDYSDTALYGHYLVVNQQEFPVAFAIQPGYFIAADSDRADIAQASFIFGRAIGPWSNNLNLVFSHELGENATSQGLLFRTAWQTLYALDNTGWKPGFEYYGNLTRLEDMPGFDRQEHILGPVVNLKTPVRGVPFEFETGVFAGLTDASPDMALKVKLGVEF